MCAILEKRELWCCEKRKKRREGKLEVGDRMVDLEGGGVRSKETMVDPSGKSERKLRYVV